VTTKSARGTITQIKSDMIQNLMNIDPEFKLQMKAWVDMLDEFGYVEAPIYLRDKLQQIEIIAQGKYNSSNLMQ
jgi:hypothetical protein